MNTPPPSLLQMTGAPTHPAPLADSALVIVDAQREYVDGRLPLAGIAAAVAEAARLLDLARRHAVPVIHIVQHSPPARGLFDETGPFVAIVPELAPRDGEAVIAKALPNAFAGTELDAHLRRLGRKEVILAGFMTHMCISSTARAALDLGYRTTIVAAATATRDLADPVGGGAIPAADVQRAALAELADRFAVVLADMTALRSA